MKRITRSKTTIWLLVVLGLMLVAGANAHLVYVAAVSQPDCVVHLRPGEHVEPGQLSAAVSSCSTTQARSKPG
jgi:hypothetical protein